MIKLNVQRQLIVIFAVVLSAFNYPVYAEVGDKIPSWSGMLLEAFLLSVLSFICILMRSKWLYPVLPAVLIFSLLAFVTDINDSDFMNSMIVEQGKNYVFFRWFGSFIMCVMSLIMAYILSHQKNNRLNIYT